jgi:hypothetical protein
MMLAMGAIAMAARMRDEDLFFAAVAMCQHHRALRGAALFQGRQGLKLAGQRLLIRRQKLSFKALDDRRKQHHFTFFQSMAKPFISALINASA